MTLPTAHPRTAFFAPTADRAAVVLRRLAEFWWLAVLTHVAELNGLPRPREPMPPQLGWPFGHL